MRATRKGILDLGTGGGERLARTDQVDQWEGQMRFADTTALVTYIGLVPWGAPGFAIEAHAQRLMDLEASAPIVVTQRRFRIYATVE